MLLGEILIDAFGMKPDDMNRALGFQDQYGGRLGSVLINMGIISEDTLINALSRQLGFRCLGETDQMDLHFESIPQDHFLNLDFLLEKKTIPVEMRNNTWSFASVDPLNLEVNAYIEESGIQVDFMLCTETVFRELYMRLKRLHAENEGWEGGLDITSGDVEKLRELASEAPIVNLVNGLVSRAVGKGASDLHFEPFRNMVRVRFRIDGMLHDVDFLPLEMQLPVASRIKILAGLDIAEKRKPQDGKISMRVAAQELDIRVSTLPLGQGESLVLRFLLKESIRYELDVLGLEKDLLERLTADVVKTSGVILLTGPTGSGKTTTLYSALNRINGEEKKIITVEDPIEYQLEGINQVQVNPEIGYDFPNALRSIVRQDPDVIMVGEIRDQATAKIAMQASLTGHLVLSTLHTNDAPSAFTRLLDLGVEEYLLNATLVSVIAQRLVRKLCPHCRKMGDDTEAFIMAHGLGAIIKKLSISHPQVFLPKGCDRCEKSGYKGRVAIMEYMINDPTLKSMPKDSRFVQNARHYLGEIGTRNLYEDGMIKVLSGVTSMEEVVRVAG